MAKQTTETTISSAGGDITLVVRANVGSVDVSYDLGGGDFVVTDTITADSATTLPKYHGNIKFTPAGGAEYTVYAN